LAYSSIFINYLFLLGFLEVDLRDPEDVVTYYPSYICFAPSFYNYYFDKPYELVLEKFIFWDEFKIYPLSYFYVIIFPFISIK